MPYCPPRQLKVYSDEMGFIMSKVGLFSFSKKLIYILILHPVKSGTKKGYSKRCNLLFCSVGARGFEPPTPWTPFKRGKDLFLILIMPSWPADDQDRSRLHPGSWSQAVDANARCCCIQPTA
jgi:hypothetical protein